jgi:predicted RNA-binding Zn-ribbon protein involved in translation (DUF1610 family)
MREDALSLVRQELFCHACNRHVQFELDMAKEGNHVLNCPNCGHEHCRVVRRGRITDDRWGQRNGPTYQVAAVGYTLTSSSAWAVGTSTATSSNFYTYYGTTTGATGTWATA